MAWTTPRTWVPGASMRPPLFSGGNPCSCSPKPTRRRSFNEASALQRRKRPGQRRGGQDRRASMRPPLFSGGNAQVNAAGGHFETASMRPPLFSGGNAGLSVTGRTSSDRLQ